MKKYAFLLVAAALLTGGCAGLKPRPAEEALYKIQILPTPPARILSVAARKDGEHLVIHGKVRQPYGFHLPGRVEIEIHDLDGSSLRTEAPLQGYASRRGGYKEGRFSVRLQAVPSPGSVIRLKYLPPGGAADK